MSIVIGLHAGRYVMLASDLRGTRYDAAGTRIEIFDDFRKMYQGPAGLVSAVGHNRLLYAVAQRLLSEPLATPMDYLTVIAAERRRVAIEPNLPDHLRQHVDASFWMLTFAAADQLLLCAMGRVGDEEKILSFPPGTCVAMVADDAHWQTVGPALQAQMRECHVKEDVLDTMRHNVALLQDAVADRAAHDDTVSAASQIGIHGWEIGICVVDPAMTGFEDPTP